MKFLIFAAALSIASVSLADPTTRPTSFIGTWQEMVQENQTLRAENERLRKENAELSSRLAAIRQPTTKPTAKVSPKEITKGMTLAEAQKIAGFRPFMTSKDDNGVCYYTLIKWDYQAEPDVDYQNEYHLVVIDGVIDSFRVDVHRIKNAQRPIQVNPRNLR